MSGGHKSTPCSECCWLNSAVAGQQVGRSAQHDRHNVGQAKARESAQLSGEQSSHGFDVRSYDRTHATVHETGAGLAKSARR